MDTPSLPSDFDALAESEEAERDYERIWALLQRTEQKRAASYNVDDEWDQLADRLDLDDAAESSSSETDTAPSRRAADRDPRPSASTSAPARRWGRGLAVAALLLCVVGGGVWWWSQPVTVATAAGERTTVTLPDGSTAELNGATTLKYPRGFSSLPLVGTAARRVRLDGEAFFSVVESERSFRVETANARVTVLGTAFNVRARSADGPPETQVAVETGRVRVASASETRASTSVVLGEAGQTSRVTGSDAPTAPTTVPLKYVQAWRQGGFGVVGAPLPVVLRELERRFDTSLRLGVPVAETDTMTLHYGRDARLTDILHDVCLLQNLSYRETSRGYELVRD